ncbi:UNVERIFIED_CONTAM: Retrovirus-related Pol polyprotein from transposon RE2 [Sesamum latifolium]|uniref:Retrovirus-related Pol polyprotein from transposon RE2 n=1 Tax=Sesamum latifolium TaxID=2727402 RepID=A0AAW2XX19_9LAMI
MYASSSRELWLELQRRYGRSNGPMIYQIQREISTVTQGDLSITAYFIKLKKLWNEITCLDPAPKCTCSKCVCDLSKAISVRNDTTQLMQFLMRLHEVYDSEQSQVLMMDPLSDIEKAFAMFLSVEKQRSVSLVLTDSYNNHSAYHISGREVRRHFVDKNAQKRKPFVDKRSLVCAHCHKTGHSKDACFKFHGVPDWYKNLPEQKKRTTGGKNFAANVGEISGDNASTSQSTNVTSQDNITSMMAEILKLVKEQHIPTDPLTSNYANYAHFDDEFAVNLFSVSQLCSSLNCSFSFSKHDWFLQDQTTKKILARGSVSKRFYVMEKYEISSFSHLSFSATQTCNEAIWHRRLGHPSVQTLKHLSICGSLNDSIEVVCEVCPLAKQARIPFPLSNSHSSAPFDLLHMDLWGPYKEHTISGCNYILTIVDNHTRSLWTFLLKQKSQKGYKLYDISSKQTFTSRDVVFYESVYPFNDLSPTSANCPLPTIPLSYDTRYSHPIPPSTISAELPPPTDASSPATSSNSPSSNTELQARNVPTDTLPQPTRKSNRNTHKPGWLDDFVCHHNTCLLHSCNPAYMSFVASLSILQEPKTYAEAAKYPEWRDAMTNELQALEQNGTWKLLPLPHDKVAIGCKWVFKTKLRADCSVERYKARLVAKGYSQIEGIDYNESFSPVAKAITSANDHCLFTLATDLGSMFLLVYVDDILITGPSLLDIQKVKANLHELFSIKDLGDARYFLGLEIARNSSGTYLAQTKYTFDIIKDTELQHSKSTSTPFPSDLKLTADSGAKLGRLLYLGFTRPDISHSVQQLSQFLNHPCEGHWSAALHVEVLLSRGRLRSNRPILAPRLRRFIGAWQRLRVAMASYLLIDFGVDVHTPVPFYCDNKAALHIMVNPVFHERTKHIEIDCHIVRNAYKEGFVLPSHVKGSEQLADIFTKSLPFKQFCTMVSKLGLVSFAPSPTCGGAVEYTCVDQQLKMRFLHPSQTQTQALVSYEQRLFF